MLYLDEIQYFNKKQQQTLLEFIENGKITLIASTTENPYFYVYNAILSRSTVFEFKTVEKAEVAKAVERAFSLLEEERGEGFQIEDGVVGHIAARLAKPLLDRLHLLKGGVPITVHAGDEHGPFRPLNGLFLVGGVVENLLQIRIDGLIRVLSVVHHTGQAVLDGPYFSGRHLVTSRSIHRFRRKRRKLTISRMLLSPQSLTALRGPHIFPAGVGRQELSRQLIQLGRCLLHRLSSEVIPQAVDLPVEVTEPPAGKRRRRLPSAYPPEIPGQGQAALSGLTLQLPLLLLRHPHLDGCRSFSVGHIDSILSDRGDRGGTPLGAKRHPFLGRPGNTKLCSLLHKTGERAIKPKASFLQAGWRSVQQDFLYSAAHIFPTGL